MSNREPELWSTDQDAEELHHYEIADAVGEYLDNLPDGESPPSHLAVYGWARKEITSAFLPRVLEYALEYLDESELANPHKVTKPTPGMLEAERAFLDAIKREYPVWACERVCEVVVETGEYLESERLADGTPFE